MKQSFLCEGSFADKTDISCPLNSQLAQGKRKNYSWVYQSEGKGRKMSVTDQVWKKQLQRTWNMERIRNMTKASLHQSIKCPEKLTKLKIPVTYVFYMLLIAMLALFLWIQDIWGRLLLEHLACVGMPNVEALIYMHLRHSVISSDSYFGVAVLLHGTSCSFQAEPYELLFVRK